MPKTDTDQALHETEIVIRKCSVSEKVSIRIWYILFDDISSMILTVHYSFGLPLLFRIILHWTEQNHFADISYSISNPTGSYEGMYTNGHYDGKSELEILLNPFGPSLRKSKNFPSLVREQGSHKHSWQRYLISYTVCGFSGIGTHRWRFFCGQS